MTINTIISCYVNIFKKRASRTQKRWNGYIGVVDFIKNKYLKNKEGGSCEPTNYGNFSINATGIVD